MARSLDGNFWQRLGITLAVLAAYGVGMNVLLPGIDTDNLRESLRAGGLTFANVSMFALGVMPLLNALIVLEIIKLVAPGVRAWELSAPANSDHIGQIVVSVVLLLTLLQAGGYASALEGADLVSQPGASFRFACVATLIGGTALMIAFARFIDGPGLGWGLWLLYLVPSLAELPRILPTLAQVTASGDYAAGSIALAAAFTVLTIGGVASIVLAARGARATVLTCIWTPFIANVVLTPILFASGLLATFNVDGATAFATSGNVVWYLGLVVVVALVVWLCLRSHARVGFSSPIPAAPIAATLAAILVGGTLLETQLNVVLPLAPAPLIVAAAVMTTLLIEWGFLDRLGPAETSEPLSPQA